MKCAHLQQSNESYRQAKLTGQWVKHQTSICGFPDDEPHRFVDAPTWLLKQIGGGQMVRPESDCVGCPAYKAQSEIND